MMGGRGVCLGVRIMKLRRWRGRKLENASLICLQANDVSTKERLDVPQYTKLCGKIQMEIGTGATCKHHNCPSTVYSRSPCS